MEKPNEIIQFSISVDIEPRKVKIRISKKVEDSLRIIITSIRSTDPEGPEYRCYTSSISLEYNQSEAYIKIERTDGQALTNDEILIQGKVVRDNKVSKEPLNVTLRIKVPIGFYPVVLYRCSNVALVSINYEGKMLTKPPLKISIKNLGDQGDNFTKEYLVGNIYQEINKKSSSFFIPRVYFESLLPEKSKILPSETKEFEVELKIKSKLLPVLLSLPYFYLDIYTISNEDFYATYKILNQIPEEEIQKISVSDETSLNYESLLFTYLKQLKDKVYSFFHQLEEFGEPLIENRTFVYFKGKRRRILQTIDTDTTENEEWEERSLSIYELIESPNNIILEGIVGIGKTVLSYQIVRLLLEKLNTESDITSQSFIPILIEGRHLSLIKGTKTSIEDFITNIIINTGDNTNAAEILMEKGTCDVIKRQLITESNNRFLLIFDGFDEIPDKKVKDWIEDIIKINETKIKVLVTGRPWSVKRFRGTIEGGIKNLDYYRIADLDDETILDYVMQIFNEEDTVRKKVELLKKLYPELYSKPLFLKILSKLSIRELTKPLSTFDLLNIINRQVLYWNLAKITKMPSEAFNIAKNAFTIEGYDEFLDYYGEETVLIGDTDISIIELVTELEKAMRHISYELAIKPIIQNNNVKNYLSKSTIDFLLNKYELTKVKEIIYKLAKTGSYWLIRPFPQKLDYTIFPTKMLEFFIASYVLKELEENSNFKPFSLVFGNSVIFQEIIKILRPKIEQKLKEQESPILYEATEKILNSQEITVFKELFAKISKNNILQFSRTHHLALIELLGNWNEEKDWEKENNISLATRNSNITHVFISNITCLNQEVEEIISSLMKFKKLTSLKILSAKLDKFPENLENLTDLEELNLWGNSLVKLPEKILKLKNLRKLILGANKINALPENFGHLTELKELNLWFNKLSTLPKSFKELQKLETLNISYNNFHVFPEEIGELKSLKNLHLWDNQLEELPESICNLTNLKTIYASNNKIRVLPVNFGLLFNLEELDLSENQLKDLPSSIGNLKKLEYLNLMRNKIKRLPDTIGGLVNLKKLNLYENSIQELPETIGNLQELEEIELYNNGNLTSLPWNIGKLKKLQILDLAKNALKELPETIGGLTELKYLYLFDNDLRELPETIGELKKLQTLDLARNNLKELPKTIGKLEELRVLSLIGNPIVSLPKEVINLKKLENLYVEKLTIENTDKKIIEQLEKNGSNVIVYQTDY